jgi:RNA polymerase sigma factor (sigma-70 family)
MTPRAREALRRRLASADEAREDLTINPEEIARYEDAVRRMPYMQRSIFLAVRLDNMAYGQVAERTGLSVKQVERQMGRALRNLRRNLDDPRRGWWRRWWK